MKMGDLMGMVLGFLEGKIQDIKAIEVFEPLSVKTQIIKSATEATSMILNVDEIVATKKIIKQVEAGPKKHKDLTKKTFRICQF
jgi:chaperonin GroEL (HSP60 family)